MFTKRTFLAISIPCGTEFPAMVERLKKNLQHEKYINYVKTNQIHMTLKFLGSTPVDDIPAIIETCQKVAKRHQPFTMDFDRTGLFGSNNVPRVLWLGMNDQPQALFDLEADLLDAFDDLGYPSELCATPHCLPHQVVGRQAVLFENLQHHRAKDLPPCRCEGIGVFPKHLAAYGADL